MADAWGSAHATLGTWNSHRALIQGWHKGLAYAKPETFVGLHAGHRRASTSTRSRCAWCTSRCSPRTRRALLTFLGAEDATPVKDLTLGGKIEHLVPLVLDSVYHALR